MASSSVSVGVGVSDGAGVCDGVSVGGVMSVSAGVGVGAGVCEGVRVGGDCVSASAGVSGGDAESGWERQCWLLQCELKKLREVVQEVRSENAALRSILEENGLVKRQSEEWKIVTGGGKLKMRVSKAAKFQGVSCKNSFSCLQEEGDKVVSEVRGKADDVTQPKGECKVKIIGDSICRYLGKKIKTKVSGNECFPGAGVDLVATKLKGLVESDSVTCLVVGGNDVHKRRSEEMLRRYREALQIVRNKGGRAVACGILPRLGHRREWMSRAIGFNCRLEAYCRENNIGFVDVWDHFYGQGQLYARDGVHLTRAGTSVLAGLIDKTVAGFR